MDETRAAVRVMQDYITEHISEEITIDDLARCSSFSPGYARKLFLKHLGMTPAVYIRRLKLSKSALRLRDEERKKRKMSEIRNVFIQVIEKPSRKVIIKRGLNANEYFSYCEEVGCDVWGLLKSIKSISGEPVCMWLPSEMRKPVTNEYVQGVEVEEDYSGKVPEGFEIIDLPAATYLLFRGEPFADEDYEVAITEIWDAEKKYNPEFIGFKWDDKNPRIQLEPRGERGYIELVPIKKI